MANKAILPPAKNPVLNALGQLRREWYLYFDALQNQSDTQSDSSTLNIRGVALYADGTLGIQSDAAPAVYLDAEAQPVSVKAYVKQAPTDADLEMTIYVGDAEWLTLTIPDGETSVMAASSLVTASGAIPSDVNIRLGITAVGSTFPGADLSVFLYF